MIYEQQLLLIEGEPFECKIVRKEAVIGSVDVCIVKCCSAVSRLVVCRRAHILLGRFKQLLELSSCRLVKSIIGG